MQPANSQFRILKRAGERGNVLFMILIAVVILGMLTYAISQDSAQQSGTLPQQTVDNQINQMLTYTSALGGALQQMAVNGENPNTLYTSLDATPPASDATFNTPPSNLKLYHPLGGGITYQSQSSPDTNAVATGYNINAASIITGVGCTAGVGCIVSSTPATGHIIFTALLSASNYCAETNKILTGSTTVPTMSSGAFNTLFGYSTTASATTIAAGNCAACVNTARLCVTNGSGVYGFYADLFPPQYSSGGQ